MKKTKLIISTVAVLMAAAISGAKAAVCMANNTAPTSCSNYTQAFNSPMSGMHPMTGSWMVWGCAGGSGIKRFAGISYCSSTGGTYAEQGNPGNSPGRYCWCALTNPAASAWVYQGDGGGAPGCSWYCAAACANEAQKYSGFRSALFNAIGS
jgi:hypothetical protein